MYVCIHSFPERATFINAIFVKDAHSCNVCILVITIFGLVRNTIKGMLSLKLSLIKLIFMLEIKKIILKMIFMLSN